MMLNILRIISLCLAFFYIGLNIAILKHHFERPGLTVVLGQMGFGIAIILAITLKLFHKDLGGNYIFNIIIIPSLVLSIVGLIKYYEQQSNIERER